MRSVVPSSVRQKIDLQRLLPDRRKFVILTTGMRHSRPSCITWSATLPG